MLPWGPTYDVASSAALTLLAHWQPAHARACAIELAVECVPAHLSNSQAPILRWTLRRLTCAQFLDRVGDASGRPIRTQVLQKIAPVQKGPLHPALTPCARARRPAGLGQQIGLRLVHGGRSPRWRQWQPHLRRQFPLLCPPDYQMRQVRTVGGVPGSGGRRSALGGCSPLGWLLAACLRVRAAAHAPLAAAGRRLGAAK